MMKNEFHTITSYSIDQKNLLKMYFTMVKIRNFENAITDVYSRGLMNGLAHLYIGEEAIATGVCANITSQDYAVSTHRGHGHLIARWLLQGQGWFHAYYGCQQRYSRS
jgi:pyruvate dehydrogenase E1 component alpha subunit